MEEDLVSVAELEVGSGNPAATELIDVEEAREGAEGPPEILAELVIEEVSIDGMCGVY